MQPSTIRKDGANAIKSINQSKNHESLKKDGSINTPHVPGITKPTAPAEMSTNSCTQTHFNHLGSYPIIRNRIQSHMNAESHPSTNISGYYSGLNKQDYVHKTDMGYQYTKIGTHGPYMNQNIPIQKPEFPPAINIKNISARMPPENARVQPHNDGYSIQNSHYYSNENATSNVSFNSAQCYHNEYDGQPEFNSGYYDPKGQSYYYDGAAYHHHHHHHPNTIGSPAVQSPIEYAPTNSVLTVSEATENYNFHQSYYDPHVINNPFHHGSNPSTNTASMMDINHQQSAHDVVYTHGTSMPISYGPNNGNLVSSNVNSNIVNLENSNSSSDFNFLSNLANDFAPEYYQLS